MRVLAASLLILICFPLAAVDEDEIFRWIDSRRESGGLDPLTEETFLVASARSYSAELRDRGILTHRDRLGRGPRDRYAAMGGTALAAGEILGTCAWDAPFGELARAWWESATHREQIMDPRWTCIGIGIEEKDGVLIACVEFSSSLLSDHRIAWENDIPEYRFTPLPGIAELAFYDPVSRRREYWRKGGETFLSLDQDRFPLLWEVRNPDDLASQRGNRLILTPETDRGASEPPRRSCPGEPLERD